MRLLTGLPQVELKATAAHEFFHAWVGENVPPERRGGLSRDAEEGFRELVAYLLMDSQGEAAQKQFILKNHYTRGQVDLFIAAEKHYGFDQILDWMQHGESSELEEGHLGKIRDVKIPAPAAIAARLTVHTNASSGAVTTIPAPAVVLAPDTVKLQGILWGNRPAVIINNHTVFANDRFKLKIGGTEIVFRCLAVRKNSVRIENVDSGKQDELRLEND